MKKIILCIMASLDQRIAESDGSLEWLTGFPNNTEKTDYGHKKLLSTVDTVLMGGRTYRELSNMDAMGAYDDKAVYVVSRNDWSEKGNIKFITENVIERILDLRNQPGKDIWLFGGGELISMLLAADLVDEMQIAYIPIILGQGIPLFPDNPKESRWELRHSMCYGNGVVKISYIKLKD